MEEEQSEASIAADMRYVMQTIASLTGGCEICQFATGPYCKKHGRPIKVGDPRCEFFVRRLPEDPEKASRDRVQQYINDSLGIRDKRIVGRLTGEP